MSNMKPDEMSILKCVSMKLDDNTAMLVTLQYHVEKNDAGKNDRAKSRYRYLVRINTIDAIKNAIADFKKDENKNNKWMWPNDPSWDGCICTKDSINAVAAEWLRMKLHKLVDFDTGIKLLNGWKKTKNEYNVKAKYDITGYTTEAGETIDLTDKDALLKLVGQNLVKEVVLKTKVTEA